MSGISKLYGENSANLYPTGRVLINNADNTQEFVITKECENNPVLLLTILYGETASSYADVFFAANHITNPYAQLIEGMVVKRVDVESMSALAATTTSNSNKATSIKVKHAKVSSTSVTF